MKTIYLSQLAISTYYKFSFQNFVLALAEMTEVSVEICYVGKVKSAYGPMWPTRPELIPVSVA